MPQEKDKGEKAKKTTLATLCELYATRRYLGLKAEEELGLRLRVVVHFKDPKVAKDFPAVGLDKEFTAPWEPGLDDGPTSARFAVVDYDGTADRLETPALWNDAKRVFLDAKKIPLDGADTSSAQFRQLSTWAIVQNTLDCFESGFGLGRPISWGFEGNRLIVLPHAGYGQNAYYDRQSKSLQFYYFDNDDGERIYTCLSSDIVNHEFGHALLDGIRPYYLEAVTPQTAAFHEFMGDLTALLMAFRNNGFRRATADRTGGVLAGDGLVAGIAREFGEAVAGSDYLRSAANSKKMSSVTNWLAPHDLSQVLTAAIFEFLVELSVKYKDEGSDNVSIADALYSTIQRVQPMAVQGLDLLPPVEVTFRDYAIATLRAEQMANPVDPKGYRKIFADVFVSREILDRAEADTLLAADYLFDRPNRRVFHDVEDIAGSRAAAYRFLDDNREDLLIPPSVDLVVADLSVAQKFTRQGRRLPKQLILQYVWREELALEEPRFGAYAGRTTTMLCGATLVIDWNGDVVHWARKPGCEPLGRGSSTRRGAPGKAAADEAQEGLRRRTDYLDALAERISAGMVGQALGRAAGLLEDSMPLLSHSEVDGALRFELTPHMAAGTDRGHDHGGMPWALSS